jgi:hypothetical protein
MDHQGSWDQLSKNEMDLSSNLFSLIIILPLMISQNKGVAILKNFLSVFSKGL